MKISLTRPAWPENLIKDQQVNGNTLSFTYDKNGADILFGKNVAPLFDSLGFSNVPINYSDINITVNLDNNPIGPIIIKFSANASVDGHELTANYTIINKITQINNVTVSFPNDLDSYIEVPSVITNLN